MRRQATPSVLALRALVLAACLAFLAAPIRAEVGVVVGAGTTAGANPYVFGITDDPDPFGYWLRFSASGSGRSVLNEQGALAGDGPPSILHDPETGLILVAWAKAVPGGFDVVASRFASGAWSAPQIVAASSANELDPELVLGPDGAVHVLYWTDDGLTRRVEMRTGLPDLSGWGSAVAVSRESEAACRPSGVSYEGVLRVAYEVHDFGFGGSPRQVVLSRLEAGGFVREVVAVTHHLGVVRPRVGSHGGRLWVDWIDAEDDEGAGEVAWVSLEGSEPWGAFRYEPYDSPSARDFFVRPGIRLLAIGP